MSTKRNSFLDRPITEIRGISTRYEQKLSKLGLKTIKDLITYFPRDYKDISKTTDIETVVEQVNSNENFLIKCKVHNFRSIRLRGKLTMQRAIAEDETAEIECVWFNQPFLDNVFNTDTKFYLYGKAKLKGNKIQFNPTNYEKVEQDESKNIHLARIVPEYKLTEGITKKWFRRKIKDSVELLESNKSRLFTSETEVIESNQMIKFISETHFPKNHETLKESIKALSILELVNVFLKVKAKRSKVKTKSKKVEVNEHSTRLKDFLDNLPFKPTNDQQSVINDLVKKLQSEEQINALVQGDVGSGKTLIAIFLSYLFALNDLQTIVLAPTTILAKQHYENFKNILPKGMQAEIELVTSDNKATKSKKILIGTSAILARKHNLIKNPGLIIVDEQHRFGVHQREELLKPIKLKKAEAIHFINMTATPIPRTIAETFFTDLEVLSINEKPAGRKPIQTFIVPKNKIEDCYKWIEQKVKKEKEQVYWICPLVEESEAIEAKSAKATYKKLLQRFKDIPIDLMHGKLKAEQKNHIMEQFTDNKTSILVSTSVIEVGVDVPNANVIIIENPERFGMAQLHQIRGRVGRSHKQAYCFLIIEDELEERIMNRINFFAKNNDGLAISEHDLERRGPGEVYGTKQSGIPNLKIAKLNNLELIKTAKEIAQKISKSGVKSLDLFN